MKTGKMLNSQTYNSRQGLTVASDGHAVSCSLVTHCRCNTSWVWRTSRLFVVEAISTERSTLRVRAGCGESGTGSEELTTTHRKKSWKNCTKTWIRKAG